MASPPGSIGSGVSARASSTLASTNFVVGRSPSARRAPRGSLREHPLRPSRQAHDRVTADRVVHLPADSRENNRNIAARDGSLSARPRSASTTSGRPSMMTRSPAMIPSALAGPLIPAAPRVPVMRQPPHVRPQHRIDRARPPEFPARLTAGQRRHPEHLRVLRREPSSVIGVSARGRSLTQQVNATKLKLIKLINPRRTSCPST
jgi:hypothetical protein